MSADDVTIPRETAREVADLLRRVRDDLSWGPISDGDLGRLADLLDPRPRSLRDEVAEALTEEQRRLAGLTIALAYRLPVADAVLAVVADWLAAQPLDFVDSHFCRVQRDHDVRLLRGES